MPPPTPLSIATSSLLRLQKEELSYHQELKQQDAYLSKLQLEPDDGNKEYLIKQQKAAIEETKRLLPTLENSIATAKGRLRDLLQAGGSEEEVSRANQALAVEGRPVNGS